MATIRREGEKNLRDLYKIYTSEGGILSYNKYKEVIELFMKEIIQKIIKTGYEFSMPYRCGLIKVIQLARTVTIKEDGTIKGAVDWGESNKLKAEIIKRGDIPLSSVKDENGKTTKETNGGVPWLCYYTSKTFFSWVWIAHVNMRNMLRYKFDVTYTNSCHLSASITDSSYLLFKLRKRDGNNTDYIRGILDTASTVEI